MPKETHEPTVHCRAERECHAGSGPGGCRCTWQSCGRLISESWRFDFRCDRFVPSLVYPINQGHWSRKIKIWALNPTSAAHRPQDLSRII